MQAIESLITHGRRELAKVIVGQSALVDGVLSVLICGGHVLIEGAPGLGKTLAVKCIARLLRVEFQRVQCTSDLMPADLLGTSVLNLSAGTFSMRRGPIFTDLLLVDEINRMPPRTQASLLEAMEERQVTLDGARHPLSGLFTVLATQNPVEFEGTYPLPEAQLDRFLMKIKIDYPSVGEEVQILQSHHAGALAAGADQTEIEPLEAGMVLRARQELCAMRVEESLFRYIAEVVRRTRTWPAVSLGASPRAAICLMLAAKAAAAFDGRDYVLPDDVKLAAPATLRHRMILRPEAELEGIDTDRIIADVLAAVEVPK